MSGVTAGLRAMLGRLQAYRVDWKYSFVPAEDKVYEPGTDREKESNLSEANVISSALLNAHTVINFDPTKALAAQELVPRHAVLIDIDYPAHLVESSTPGHYHLYLDVPGGVKHEDYMELLAMLAKCKIIEQGYADVSIARGHSDLRLPWVSKDDQKKHEHNFEPPSEPTAPLDPYAF